MCGNSVRPGWFYVTARMDSRSMFLYGPYKTYEAAINNVDKIRNITLEIDDKMWFASFGVTRVDDSGEVPDINVVLYKYVSLSTLEEFI